jgi:hypothetical protein
MPWAITTKDEVLLQAGGQPVSSRHHCQHDLGIPTSILSCGEGNADRRLELLCPRRVLVLIITVAAILGKMIGCGVRVYRLRVKPAVEVGMGMIPCVEVMIIVADRPIRQHSISDSAGQEFVHNRRSIAGIARSGCAC